MPVFALDSDHPIFPPPSMADSSGLLAVGGQLEIEWLLEAYSNGIFPWYNENEPLMWWSPDPRSVIIPGDVKITKSMRSYLKKNIFELRVDYSFSNVLENCKRIKRKDQDGTWITDDMKRAYNALHDLGFAHSIETWHNNELVGGLYGVSLGKMFFGESMFSSESNASKFAFICLSTIMKQNEFELIDCQVPNQHLTSMGCIEISREEYLKKLEQNQFSDTIQGSWGNGLIKSDISMV